MSILIKGDHEKAGDIYEKRHIIPASALRGVATGLLMMTFFTGIWAGIAYGGLFMSTFRFVLILFLVFMILFLVNGVRFFRIAKKFPGAVSHEDATEKKRMGKWFGIIFGAEGLAIFLAVNIVIKLGHPDLIIPAIALVVALHFYPMAKIFKRKIDYWLATWATLIAICGFILTLNKTIPSDSVQSFVGIGIALATSSYGIYMIMEGKRFIKWNGL
jgi:hypothetical protein